MNKEEAKDLYEKARKHVHTDATLLVRQYAAMDTVENLGQNVQSLFLRFFRPMDPEHALKAAYDMIASESASEGIPADDEFRESVKDGRAALARVQQKGLPLTVENLDHAYMGTGPFEKAKKGGKAKSKAK